MDQPTDAPDPYRTVTPGGFFSDSPFARQNPAVEPKEAPATPAKPQPSVSVEDLEEAYHQLQDLIRDLEHTTAHRVARSANVDLQGTLEDVSDLIYRNLR